MIGYKDESPENQLYLASAIATSLFDPSADYSYCPDSHILKGNISYSPMQGVDCRIPVEICLKTSSAGVPNDLSRARARHLEEVLTPWGISPMRWSHFVDGHPRYRQS